MPQASGHTKNFTVPFGRGSLCHNLMQARARTLRRATKVNYGSEKHLESYKRMITRHQIADNNRKNKVLQRIERSIEELEAYKKVMESMKVKDFKTLQYGFHPRDIKTPNSSRRYKLERRIMNVGFSIQSLYPQVLQTIEDSDPEKIREEERARLLEESRKLSNFSIDRRITDRALRREQLLKELEDANVNIEKFEEISEIPNIRNSVQSLPKIRSLSEPINATQNNRRRLSEDETLSAPTLKLKPLLVSRSYVKDKQ